MEKNISINHYNEMLREIIAEVKMTHRAESPLINSVGQRPMKRYAYPNPKPQRGVINLIINH